jgi:hypothetical protein
MPTYYISKVPTSCHHLILIMKVVLFSIKVDISCFSYIVFKTLCVFSTYFIKCAKYIHHKIRYDGNFFKDDFNKLIMKY